MLIPHKPGKWESTSSLTLPLQSSSIFILEKRESLTGKLKNNQLMQDSLKMLIGDKRVLLLQLKIKEDVVHVGLLPQLLPMRLTKFNLEIMLEI
jgi:hypothetical protein